MRWFESLESRTLLSVSLVKDLTNNTLGSFPNSFVTFKNEIYFVAGTSETGAEIYRSNGTTATLVKDTSNNPFGFGPFDLTVAGNYLFFDNFHNFDGGGLWRTDGTSAGTIRLLPDADVLGIAALGSNALIFVANADGSGTLWTSDGTTRGTRILKNDIRLIENFGLGKRLATIGNAVYFQGASAADGKGFEVYKTDGSAAGTGIVTDVNPGPGSSNPLDFTAVGNQIFFQAVTPAQEGALFVTDGTPGNATQLKVLNSLTSYEWLLTAFNNKLYFTTVDDPFTGSLWISDGTSNGTQILKSGVFPSSFVTVGNTFYFSGRDSSFNSLLFKSNGTAAGTTLVTSKVKGINSLVNFNGTLFFSGVNSKGTADGLYKTAGTEQTTALVRDINPTGADDIFGYGIVGNKLFFNAFEPATGAELHVTDGTSAGTKLVADIDTDTASSQISKVQVTADGHAYFLTELGNPDPDVFLFDLYVTDGTAANTKLLLHSVSIGESCVVGNNLYFAVHQPNSTSELWFTNGTAAGTRRVAGVISPRNMVALNGVLLFNANQPRTDAFALWKSDGSSVTLLKQNISLNSPGDFRTAALLGNKLLFAGNDITDTNPANGIELYITDGTAAGTGLLKDLNPIDWSSPFNLTTVGNKVYFGATGLNENNELDTELYVSDGTAAGTTLVADVNPTGSSFPTNLVGVGNTLYFFDDDGTDEGVPSLFTSNGTASTTKKVRGSLFPEDAVSFNGKLAFTATDTSTSKSGLWLSDGTSRGTAPVSKKAGDMPVLIDHLNVVGNALYFGAFVPGNFDERHLWQSDGTVKGTIRVDLGSAPFGNNPIHFSGNGSVLYFVADTFKYGEELWRIVG